MAQYRIERLESLLREEIADIVKHEITDIGSTLITITKIILSKDLRHAKVYVSIYNNDESNQNRVMRKLRESSRMVKGIVGRRIRMRYVPEINFVQDHSMEEATRIFQIMQGLKEESDKKISAGLKKKR